MNLYQSSQTLEFFRRFGSAWEMSVTHRATKAILVFWDRLVSGSIFIYWVTGSDLTKKVTTKRSVFADDIQKCWTSLLTWINKSFITNQTLGQSPILRAIHNFSGFINENLFCSIGWLGCAFFPTYGILRLAFVGISSTLLIVLIAGFILSVILILTHVRLDELISSSRLLKVLDDLDE